MKNSPLKITIALVCHQEKERLALVLEDLKNQSAFESIGELLLFQNGNCAKTRKTAEGFLKKLPLKIFSAPSNNLGRARGFLVKKSQYKLMAFADSDCRLPKNWLEELARNWEKAQADFQAAGQKPLAAVGGPNRLPETSFWRKMANLSLSHPLGHGWSPQAWQTKKPAKVGHIPTTNGLFLKQAILSAGNFSGAFPLAGEDLDLGLRLENRGAMILFPQPMVINNYADSYFESLKRLFSFGQIRQKIYLQNLKGGAFKKDKLAPLRLLLAPLMAGCLIGGAFKAPLLLAPGLYILFLLFSGLFKGWKSKKPESALLPFFWLAQHFAYSSGALFGLFRLKQTKNQRKNP